MRIEEERLLREIKDDFPALIKALDVLSSTDIQQKQVFELQYLFKEVAFESWTILRKLQAAEKENKTLQKNNKKNDSSP